MSQRNYQVQTKIKRPVDQVFKAIADENAICRYFTDSTSGPLVEGQKIIWHWNQWGDHPVIVKKLAVDQQIHLQLDSGEWNKTSSDHYPVDILIEFESLDEETTLLSISEQGWRLDDEGLRGSHDNCSGWTHMAMCLKAYIEHGIDMRR